MRRYPDKTCKHCTIIRDSEEECHNTVMELCKILDDIDEITASEDLELKNSLIKKS